MKKKIFFFLTSLNAGGTEKVTISYLNALASSGNYQIILGVMFHMTIVPTLEKELNSNIKVVYLSSESVGNKFCRHYQAYSSGYVGKIRYAMFRILWNFLLEKKFHNLASNFSPSVMIQADTGMPSYFKHYSIPKKIIFVHFSLSHLFSNFLKTYRIKLWIKQLSNFTYVVTISKNMFDQLEPFCTKGQLVLIYNPIQVSNIIKLSKKPFTLPDEIKKEQYIVSVARLDENQKDFACLIRSISILQKEGLLTHKLLIIGDGRDRMHLEQLVQDLQLTEVVYFLGHKQNPFPYISHSALLILSSKFEGLPTVLLEALFLNKLAISSDCPTGPAEILDHPSLLVPVGSPSAMAEGIRLCLTDKALKKELLTHYELLRQKFAPSDKFEQFENLLNS